MAKEDQWFARNSAEITEKYGGQWIAIVDEEIVAHADTFELVDDQVNEMSTRPMYVFVPEEDVVVYAN